MSTDLFLLQVFGKVGQWGHEVRAVERLHGALPLQPLSFWLLAFLCGFPGFHGFAVLAVDVGWLVAGLELLQAGLWTVWKTACLARCF